MARNDAHAPSNLVTEDYEYIFAADLNTAWAVNLDREFLGELLNYDPALAARGQGQCHHCGARLRYAAWLRHVPTGYTIVVGETCLDNRFGRATADFHALRKQAQLDREAQRIKTAVADFVSANPDLAFMADKHHEHTNEFVADVARKLRLYGSLSDRQIEAVRRAVARDIERAARLAEEAANPAPVAPVFEGKGLVEGEVLSIKVQYGDYGSTLKMLVKDDRGFKVWGSVPAALIKDIERGDRVAFSATVEASRDDDTFGFFKRPTKARFINKKED